MKNLNQNSTKIAVKLLELLINAGSDSLVINNNGENSGIMSVHLEKREPIIFISNGKATIREIFSVAHYFEQNGDLMSDPYMEFTVGDDIEGNKIVIPILFHQDQPYVYQDAITRDENGSFKGYYPKMQKDITVFANMWMKNISFQQGIMKMQSAPQKP